MSKIYYQEDCNLSMLDGQTIAIIGYGSQGHAHALNLKESGCNVIVGLYEGSRSWKRAQEQGFEVYTAAEAAKRADVIMILINDELQADMYKKDIETLYFMAGIGYLRFPAPVRSVRYGPAPESRNPLTD